MRVLKNCLLMMMSLVVLPVSAQTADAQAFPSKTIQIIAPFPPGGATDIFARALSEGFRKAWGQPAIVENRAGASGMIGADSAARSPNDGHTMVIGAASLHSILPLLSERMGNTQKGLIPISQIGVNPSYVVVPSTLPVNTIEELIKYVKQTPGEHPYGSAGSGTSQHVFVELFKQRAGVDLFHVPYKGSGPMITDLVGGRLVMVIEQGPAVLPHIKAGKLKALAVTTPNRSLALPDVPTLSEKALPGFEASTWFAVYGPAGIPREVVLKLNKEIQNTLAEPDVRKRFIAAGIEPKGSTPDELDQLQRRDMAKWAEVIKRANIKLE
jgi:tripartite-type tricarboxylate transporter receptor subunit TctC